jgi:hypothetical protein
VAVCADPSVLGRAFYLMAFVDGWSPLDQDGWPRPPSPRRHACGAGATPPGAARHPALAISSSPAMLAPAHHAVNR